MKTNTAASTPADELARLIEDNIRYKEDILDDLTQHAIDTAMNARYRKIVSSMGGRLAGLSFDVKGEDYQGLVRDFNLALSHVAKHAYLQALRDSHTFPNICDSIREHDEDNPQDKDNSRFAIYDFHYELPQDEDNPHFALYGFHYELPY